MCNAPISWCSALDGRLLDDNARGPGFAAVVVGSVHDESPGRVLGIVYMRDAGDSGLMCNFCPFCGAPINAGFHAGGA